MADDTLSNDPKNGESPNGEGSLITMDIEQELRRSYLGYAVSTLVNRALPDIRDGFKPVQRRIVYAMRELGVGPGAARVKSAKIIGETMGNYHPHGDSALYGTMVRMAQDFSLRYPLVDGQGNFGCFTGDTKIKLLDGTEQTFAELSLRSPDEVFYVYSVDKNGHVVVGEGRNSRVTRRDANLVEVTLDTCEKIRCTPDHRFLLRNGQYRQAQHLAPDDSLMPGYFDSTPVKEGLNSYLRIFQPTLGQYEFVHHIADRFNAEKGLARKFAGPFVRHHKNFNRWDNSPTNLERMEFLEHLHLHNEHIAELWEDPETVEMHRDKIARQWDDDTFREAQSAGVRRSNSRRLQENPSMMSELADKAAASLTQKWKDPEYKARVIRQRVVRYLRQLSEQIDDATITPEVYEKNRHANWIPKWETALQYFASLDAMLVAVQNNNHRVVSVVHLDETTDVYDITVDEHHNFLLAAGVFVHNSVDGDSPAAMRYTEARMTPIAMEMLEDIERDTVDWRPNYDQSRREPVVLPGKFPNFLCNGGEGIAVGMSTSVPPHNLREVVDASIYALDHPDATPDDLMKFVLAPDFPTAGFILGTKGAKEAYRTGRGRVIMQAQFQIEPMDNGKNAIVVTELPYQVNKSRLIEYIADLVRHKKVEGITDIADYSDKHGMRIVIELRRDIMPKRMVNYLLKHTALRQTFGIIMLALVNGQPRLLNLAQCINLFLAHRKEVIVRRTRYELARAKQAAHIREGLQIALDFLDEIIALIRRSPNSETARTQMVERFGLTQIQAEAILNMQLRQLAQLERQKIEDEYKNLLKQIAFFEDILVTPARVVRIIKDELRALKDKYGDDRRTRIIPTEADEITEDDLIPEEKTLVTISRDGYMKRVPLDTYRTQKRGGRGVQAANLKEEDQLAHLFGATTTHYILFFTDRGRVYRLKAYEVPATSRQARGQHINNFIQIEPGDKITAILPIKDMNSGGYLFLATEHGEVKRTALSEFANLRVNGKKCFDIEEGDSLNWVKHTDGEQEVILVTRKGMSIRFKEADVPERGYTAGGVRGIDMRDPKTKILADAVVGMDVVGATSQLLVASQKGFGKRTDMASYRAQSRGGRGILTMNVTPKTGPIVDAAVVEPDDKLMVLTEKGVTIRMEIMGIRATGRTTQGVKLINLDDSDRVITIERLITTDEVEEEANAAAEAQAAKLNGGSAAK